MELHLPGRQLRKIPVIVASMRTALVLKRAGIRNVSTYFHKKPFMHAIFDAATAAPAIGINEENRQQRQQDDIHELSHLMQI